MARDSDPTLANDEAAPGRVAGSVPKRGDVIAGKYQVVDVLGAGGMGVVVSVKHLQLGELYAMKFLLPDAVANAETHGRFMREARAAVRIKSEHVARVADVGELESGAPYLLMEYLEGTDLADLLADQGALPIETACDYVMQAAAGIAEAHALGIIHRDLKPANLFLTRRSDGAALVKVLDFGIAKAIEEGPFNTSLTETQSVFGSPAYMSPEQLRSAKNVDKRTDLWGLGVILYELLAGQSPWQGETQSGLLAAIAADPPDSLLGYRPEVPAGLEAVVMRCLEKDRNKRFQDIGELVTALAPFADTTVVSVDRIVRLSTGTGVMTPRASFRPVRTAAAPESSPTEFARTEKPWTTQKATASTSGRFTLLALGALGAAAMIVLGVVFMKKSALSNPVAPAVRVDDSAMPAPLPPSPLPTTSPSAVIVAVEATAPTIAAPTTSAKLKPGARGAVSAVPVRSATLVVSPPPPVALPPPIAPHVDPAGDSH